MEVETIINMISNNGIGIVCVGFMMYFINTIMKEVYTMGPTVESKNS